MSSLTPLQGRENGRGKAFSEPGPAVDEDAERAVLGALLLYGDPRGVLRLVGKGLSPDSFYWYERHGAVFAAMVALAKRQTGADAITVYAEMERLGTTSERTRQDLEDLHGYVPAAGHVSHYADRVIEQAQWRERQRVARAMLEAVQLRDREAWATSVAPFRPDPAPDATGPSVLRLVDETGEVVGEELRCDGCDTLKDQLKGAQTEISGWRARYANLERDKLAEAQKHADWLPLQALFEHWKTVTGHKNSKWTSDRFWAAVPLYRKYGPAVFERAVAGIGHDPYTNTRRNGTVQKYDSWATLCKNADAFEEYANRAPKGWKVSLKISVEAEPEKPRLALAEGA